MVCVVFRISPQEFYVYLPLCYAQIHNIKAHAYIGFHVQATRRVLHDLKDNAFIRWDFFFWNTTHILKTNSPTQKSRVGYWRCTSSIIELEMFSHYTNKYMVMLHCTVLYFKNSGTGYILLYLYIQHKIYEITLD